MPDLKLELFDSKILFQVARPVAEAEFGEDLQQLTTAMLQKMYSERGVGLAAPQVGDSRRFFVMDVGYVSDRPYGEENLAVVNPEILWESEETSEMAEGCLSYPELQVKIKRPNKIRVKFCSPTGQEQEQELEGWLARCFLHEFEHLNGSTLYTHASHLKRSMYMKKIKKLRKNFAQLTAQSLTL